MKTEVQFTKSARNAADEELRGKPEEPESVREARVFAAIGTMTRPLSYVAGTAAALVGIATIVGWAGLRAYFKGVGAPWAIWLVDPSHFVTQALVPLTTVLLVASWLLYIYVDAPQFDERKRFRFAAKCAAFGLLAIAAHFALDAWVFESYRSHWNIVAYGAFGLAVIAVLSIAVKLIVELINEPSSTMKIHLIVLLVFTFSGVMIPAWRSNGQSDARSSTLHFVDMAGESCRWRMVRPLARDRVLLVDSKDRDVFRVATLEEVLSIRSASHAACLGK